MVEQEEVPEPTHVPGGGVRNPLDPGSGVSAPYARQEGPKPRMSFERWQALTTVPSLALQTSLSRQLNTERLAGY
jgi:hypothetical protein